MDGIFQEKAVESLRRRPNTGPVITNFRGTAEEKETAKESGRTKQQVREGRQMR